MPVQKGTLNEDMRSLNSVTEEATEKGSNTASATNSPRNEAQANENTPIATEEGSSINNTAQNNASTIEENRIDEVATNLPVCNGETGGNEELHISKGSVEVEDIEINVESDTVCDDSSEKLLNKEDDSENFVDIDNTVTSDNDQVKEDLEILNSAMQGFVGKKKLPNGSQSSNGSLNTSAVSEVKNSPVLNGIQMHECPENEVSTEDGIQDGKEVNGMEDSKQPSKTEEVKQRLQSKIAEKDGGKIDYDEIVFDTTEQPEGKAVSVSATDDISAKYVASKKKTGSKRVMCSCYPRHKGERKSDRCSLM